MNRKAAITAVSQKLGLPEKQVEATIDAFLEYLTDALVDGQTLVFRNFGKLEPRERAAIRRTNPKTGVTHDIPRRRSAGFTPSPQLKRRLNLKGREG